VTERWPALSKRGALAVAGAPSEVVTSIGLIGAASPSSFRRRVTSAHSCLELFRERRLGTLPGEFVPEALNTPPPRGFTRRMPRLSQAIRGPKVGGRRIRINDYSCIGED